jgi:hypothetical protein
MNEKFENILDKCLERITLKGENIEACLNDYPEHAGRLEPLLRMAVSTFSRTHYINARPEQKLKVKNQMLMDLQHRQQEQVKVVRGSTWKWSWAMAAIFLVLLLVGSGTVLASSKSLPGQPLYTVKTTVEKVQLKLTPSDVDKAKLHAKFAERRVEEMVAIEKRNSAQELQKLAQRAMQELNYVGLLAESQKTQKNGQSVVEKLRTRLEQSSVLACSDSLPDQPLYPVKIAVEETVLKLTTSELAQAKLRIEFAGRRVQEMVIISSNDKTQQLDQLEQSEEQHLGNLNPLAESLMSQGNRESDIEEIKALLQQATIHTSAMLEAILKTAPAEIKSTLQPVFDKVLIGYEHALQYLSKIK